jgi:tetratricopeptide (TPR) repeat protein
MLRLEQLLKLKEATPDDPLANYAVALEYFNLERWDEAVTAFEKTLEIDAKYTAAYYHKARAEIRGDKREAARSTLAAGMECARGQGDMKTEREMRELLETIA